MIQIEKRIVKTPLGMTRTYYRDHTNIREYRRIAGGIAWPSGEASGFLCVIGEDDNTDRRLQLRHYWLLVEHENRDVNKLIKRMYDIQNRYLVTPWYGDDENVLMMHFIDRFNRGLSAKKRGVFIAGAPFVDDVHNLKLYSHQIFSLTTRARKSLHFGNFSQIPGQLSGISPEEIEKKKASDYPRVAALGYCLAGLDEPYVDISKDRELHEQYVQRKYVEGL